MTRKVRELLQVEEGSFHRPVVLKVKRSCETFCNDLIEELNSGTYDFFMKRIMKMAKDNDALTSEKMVFFLHQISQRCNFNIRVIQSLLKKDVEEIIEL